MYQPGTIARQFDIVLTVTTERDSYQKFFSQLTELTPYEHQVRLAAMPLRDRVINLPTGSGKTLSALTVWLWKSRTEPASTPRRLIYCLPVRVLVEQTVEIARQLTERLGKVYPREAAIQVYSVIGGEVEDEWLLHPESRAIIVGTQDMLLSRALNRGYAESMFRWPVSFALVNNDVFWVVDEFQLFGCGLPTTLQLAGLRRQLGIYGNTATWWMSATSQESAFRTPDYGVDGSDTAMFELSGQEKIALGQRWENRKRLYDLSQESLTTLEMAERIARKHQRGTLTLVVMNTVKRAQELYRKLVRQARRETSVLLLHSRFRAEEREASWRKLSEPIPPEGRIVVSTQVVEAGVDLDSTTLFTELAPYPSLVQRFGRCNRRGIYEGAVFLLPTSTASPYNEQELKEAHRMLDGMVNVAPANLNHAFSMAEKWQYLRKKDLWDLFDTTPDLTGANLDISRFVRELDGSDVRVFWMDVKERDEPPARAPREKELCAVPVGEVRELLRKERVMWKWKEILGKWERLTAGEVKAGDLVLLRASDGGYTREYGWEPTSREPVPVLPLDMGAPDSYEGDRTTANGYWQTLAAHASEVVAVLRALLVELEAPFEDSLRNQLLIAAAYHDWGKAHEVFQETMYGAKRAEGAPLLAKSATMGSHKRRGFRHELASALGLLQEGLPPLVAYLAGAHHGKVRMSLRSLPLEQSVPNIRSARGVHEGDCLPEFSVANCPHPKVSEIKLTLEPMELGESEEGKPSWATMVWRLANEYGPFRLGYLETLLRVADIRATQQPQEVLPCVPS